MDSRDDKDVIGILRGCGLQVTYQRLAIFQSLWDTKMHPSAESIYNQVRKRFPMISLGTVYKTLEKFCEVGLIQKVSPVTETARYDAFMMPHDHAVCIGCQAILDVPTVPDRTIGIPDVSSFNVVSTHVVFQGFCPTCAAQGKKHLS